MKVEECIRKRKEDIAEALKNETSYVVANEQNGWGMDLLQERMSKFSAEKNEKE